MLLDIYCRFKEKTYTFSGPFSLVSGDILSKASLTSFTLRGCVTGIFGYVFSPCLSFSFYSLAFFPIDEVY